MIKLSYSNLMRNKGRSFLTTIGIIIGVAAIISLVSISDGIQYEAEATLGSYQYIFLMQSGVLDDTLSYLNTDIIPKIERVSGVKAYTSAITVQAKSFNGKKIELTSGDISGYALIAGIEPEKAYLFENTFYWYKAETGRMLKPGEENSILVTQKMLEDYNLFLGSSVEVNGQIFRIIGTIKIEGSLGGLADMIVMDLDKAREFSAHEDDEVGIINVLPNDLRDIDKLITRLEETFEGEASVFTSEQTTEILGTFLGSLTTALWLVSGIAAIVGGIGVMNTMLMSVMERIQEFGVLKAIGWKNSHIMAMVVGEAMIIGLLGGIMGILLGFLGSWAVELASGIPTSVSFMLVVQVLFFSIMIGVVSSIYPAIIAARMSPVEAVTYE